ncbi:MAG: hypothetical protein LBQ38_08120 [Spirochaetaceae bacterium]|nr:hypothetical protein [Spirochaetaceae bacterium]
MKDSNLCVAALPVLKEDHDNLLPAMAEERHPRTALIPDDWQRQFIASLADKVLPVQTTGSRDIEVILAREQSDLLLVFALPPDGLSRKPTGSLGRARRSLTGRWANWATVSASWPNTWWPPA